MAAFPTGWFSPGLVTRPTPSPPSIRIPGSSLRLTSAKTRRPWVASGSSPPSLRTAQRTFSLRPPFSGILSVFSISRCSRMPFGVFRAVSSTSRPESSISARRLGGSRRAGPGGIAAPQFFMALQHIHLLQAGFMFCHFCSSSRTVPTAGQRLPVSAVPA